MDPGMYSYSPPNAAPPGLPQESKLSKYMNRSASTPVGPLAQAMGNLNLDSSPQSMKKMMINEFVPMAYYQPGLVPEPPDNATAAAMAAHLATMPAPPPPPPQVHQENVGGTTYFYPASPEALGAASLNTAAAIGPEALSNPMAVAGASPYAARLYAGTPPQHLHPLNMKPGLAATFYHRETIREEVLQRNNDAFLSVDLHQYPDLPENVEMYSDLVPLESPVPHSLATAFRATHRETGEMVALRRLHSYATVPGKRLDLWKSLDHSNLVKMHEYFTTTAFGDLSLVLVYAYHPSSVTLVEKYLPNAAASAQAEAAVYMDPFSSDPDAPRPYTHQKNAVLRAVASGVLLPEAVLWSLVVQISAGLRALHNAGLSCRALDASKIIMNGPRVRITWGGVVEALHGSMNDLIQAQQDDMTALGRLTLGLASRSVHCENIAASLDLVTRSYSSDFKNVILYLLQTSRRSLTDLMPMIGARYYTQIEALQRRADLFEEELAREVDNGRLLRLLIKLGVINERPDMMVPRLNKDGTWSETGDRYLLKLFRDWLFHGVTEEGRAWLDLAHIAHSLNNLDSGTEDKVQLVSRDEQSVLVVSYSELKHCLETAFDEVVATETT